MSTGVGAFVQRTIRKAGFPWKIVNAQRSLPSRTVLSNLSAGRSPPKDDRVVDNGPQEPAVELSAGRSQLTDDGMLGDESQEHQVDQSTTRSPQGSQHGSRPLSVELDQAETIGSPPYTDGPSQVIMSNDGTKDCLAILLTKRLVYDFDEINQMMQRLEYLEKKYIDIDHEVNVNQIFVDGSMENLELTRSEDERVSIMKEVEECKEILLKDTEVRDSLKEEVRTERDNLRYLQALQHETFKKLLGDADLLSPSKPDPTLEKQEEKGSAAGSIAQSESNDSVISLEQLYKQSVLENLTQARQTFVDLQTAFDDNDQTYQSNRQQFRQRVLDGETTHTETEFNICYLQGMRDQSRGLIEAEDAYDNVLQEARDLGLVENSWDQESNFVDDVDDGYSLSLEDDMKTSVDHALINAWMDGIPLPQNSQDRASKIEEARGPQEITSEIEKDRSWQNIPSGIQETQEPQNPPAENEETKMLESPIWDWQPTGFFGSLSMVFESPSQRKRAARWEKIMGVEREEAERSRIKFMELQLSECGYLENNFSR